MKNRVGVVLINSVSTYVRMGVSMLLGLLVTRTALDILVKTSPNAKEAFGIFMLLLSVSTAAQFLNESAQQALVRFLSTSLYQGDYQQTKRLFNSGWLMSTMIGIAVALGMVGLAPWIISIFNVPENLVASGQFIVQLVALVQVMNAMSQPWAAVLGADDRYTLINVLSVLQQALTLAGLYLIPFLSVDPLIGLSLMWVMPSVLIGITLAVWVGLQKPLFRLDWQYIHWQNCRNLFSLGGWSSLIGLASNLFERTDQILINLLLGPASNAIYAIAVQLGGALNRLVTSFTSVLLPTASRIADGGSILDKQQLILRSTRYVLTLALPCVCSVAVFRREIIEFWLGRGFEAAITILPLTLLLVLCRMPIFVTWPYLTATNQLKLPALAIFFDGAFNVLLSIWYVKALNLGLGGIILGTLSTNVIRFICFQIPFVVQLVELPILQYWKEGYLRPLSLMLWLVPALWLIKFWKLPVIFMLPLLLLTATCYVFSAWSWVFSEYERQVFFELFNHRLNSRTPGS